MDRFILGAWVGGMCTLTLVLFQTRYNHKIYMEYQKQQNEIYNEKQKQEIENLKREIVSQKNVEYK